MTWSSYLSPSSSSQIRRRFAIAASDFDVFPVTYSFRTY